MDAQTPYHIKADLNLSLSLSLSLLSLSSLSLLSLYHETVLKTKGMRYTAKAPDRGDVTSAG